MPDPINWTLDLPYFVAVFIAAYIIGSIPFGFLLTKSFGVGDIRKIGSGNIGATNVLRTGRKGLAGATLLLDCGKGFSAVYFAGLFGTDLAIIAAWGSVIGHLYPVWLKFKGGKGVATTIGTLISLHPLLGFYACLTWLSIALLLRYSSLASIFSITFSPIFAWWMGLYQIAEGTTILVIFVLIKHLTNIKRLLNGDEPKIGKTTS